MAAVRTGQAAIKSLPLPPFGGDIDVGIDLILRCGSVYKGIVPRIAGLNKLAAYTPDRTQRSYAKTHTIQCDSRRDAPDCMYFIV